MAQTCTHLDQVRRVKPSGAGCKECLETGEEWVALRMCLSCGHVGCCDSSQGQHATKHFHDSGHPVMKSVEPGDDWRWCYVDRMYV
jgi:uncharacterized UBP type Zn finger protein